MYDETVYRATTEGDAQGKSASGASTERVQHEQRKPGLRGAGSDFRFDPKRL